MDRVKRVLALLSLASMGVFVIACVVLMILGQLQQQNMWIYGPMAAFLLFGLPSLLIDWLQKRAAKQKQQEEEKHD